MKTSTNTNIKRRVKHSIKHRAQRKANIKHTKTHKNTHTKTQLKQHKTHRGGSSVAPPSKLDQISIDITQQNINAFIEAYTNVKPEPINNICNEISFYCNDIDGNDDLILITNSINIIAKQFSVLNKLTIQCKLIELPNSIGNLTALTLLVLDSCVNLITLPESIKNLQNLEKLLIFNCALKYLPDDININQLQNLKTLSIMECPNLDNLPVSIGNLTHLQTLDIDLCSSLATLPASIGSLTSLIKLSIYRCYALTVLPESIGNLTSLTHLIILSCNALKVLPESIGNLTSLIRLNISKCALTQLPKSLWLLEELTNIQYDYDTIQNPEILYLMPLIKLGSDRETTYLTDINTKADYKVPINEMLDLKSFTTSNFTQHADNKTKQLNASVILGISRQISIPSTYDIDDLLEANTYLRAIPYGLNPTMSIFDQIGTFTKLRK